MSVSDESGSEGSAASVVLHDFCPLTDTLDWRLGKLAYQARGTRLFVNNAVPNLLHQGGLAPFRAAEVLLASFTEARQRGTLADEIIVVEPGMGLGLLAVQVLDRLKARCAETWSAAGSSPATPAGWCSARPAPCSPRGSRRCPARPWI